MAVENEQNQVCYFAKTNFRNKEVVFGIKEDDRRRHMYVIGKTGMGKTNMIQNMAIQDIRSGKGVAIVDPHGEFAEECLQAVPSHRVNDVIYFNPADTDFPIAMNIMEKVDPEYRHLVASGLVGVFKKLWADSWGPRLEYLLRNAILALLEYPSSTLLGVNRLLIDKEYRAKVLEKVSDPVVRSFWTDEFTKYHDRLLADAIAPIQNKVGQFLSSSLIRNVVGQTRSSFSVREAMDQGKILIMNLSKGKIGEDNSALLGAMMITKIQLAAMARVDIPEKERKDFYLYVDEFQNFATESFANILSEARKYRLSLILANQFITQVDEKVRDAVFGNVGTLVTFRVGAMDGEFLEKEFDPVFFCTDLVNLGKHNIYIKLMIDGIAAAPFSAVTLPPISLEETASSAEKVIKVSRERYGSDKASVEDKISRWAGMVKPEVKAKIDDLVKQQFRAKLAENGRPNLTNAEVEKKNVPVRKKEDLVAEKPDVPAESGSGEELFETECSGCGDKVMVPFKPDGVRPVFCKECLKNYRREQAKLQQELTEKPPVNEPAPIKVFRRKTGDPVGQNRTRPFVVGPKNKAEVDKSAVRNLIQEAIATKTEKSSKDTDPKDPRA